MEYNSSHVCPMCKHLRLEYGSLITDVVLEMNFLRKPGCRTKSL